MIRIATMAPPIPINTEASPTAGRPNTRLSGILIPQKVLIAAIGFKTKKAIIFRRRERDRIASSAPVLLDLTNLRMR